MLRYIFGGFIVILAVFIYIKDNENNVCVTFMDYYSNRDRNKLCYHNPDYNLTTPQIIQRHGYPAETHQVTTTDGYILTLFRIPHGKKRTKKRGKPIFLQHGITLNSGSFVTIGRKSLGFILADAGYDVWLGNFRGSRYSSNHTNLNQDEDAFWNFSFHEHGIYDLRSQLKHVYSVTQQKVYYLGFSMGSTSFYIYATTYPEEARNLVEYFIGIAPVGFLNNLGFLKYLSYAWAYVAPPVQALSNGRIYPRPPLPASLFKLLCLPYPIQMQVCQALDMLILGFDYEQNDPETLPVTLLYNNDATTVKTISHYLQIHFSGKFQNFDYGPGENGRVYGQEQPPEYDFSKLRVPTHLIAAENDLLATKKDVEKAHEHLPDKIKSSGLYVVPYKKFNHIDFLIAKDADNLVYNYIVKFLNQH